MRLGFDCVNKVGELHGILDEENRDVVPIGACKHLVTRVVPKADTYPTISQLPSAA